MQVVFYEVIIFQLNEYVQKIFFSKFYGVSIGVCFGIYRFWSECWVQVDGVKGVKFKCFRKCELVEKYLKEKLQLQLILLSCQFDKLIMYG